MNDRPIDDFAALLRGARQGATAGLQAFIEAVPEGAWRFAEAWNEVGPQILTEIAEAAQSHLREFAAAVPANWADLTNPQIFAAVELMQGVGWSLVGTPSAVVIEALLAAATPAERRAILLESAPEISEHVEGTLQALLGTEYAACADAGLEALAAMRTDHHRASQALTTATLTTAIHKHVQHKSHAAVRKEFLEAQTASRELADFRWVAVQGAVAKVLEPYDVLKAPPRSDYKRNASAHRVAHPQYSQANALSSLMLLASLLHELQLRSRRRADAAAHDI